MDKFIDKVTQGDCLEVMKEIPDKSVQLILCDLPYGTTAAKWDSVIPFDLLWAEYERIIKDDGAIVLTAAQPFTSALIMSNIKLFRYQWYWLKNKVTGFANAKKQPLRNVEDVVVFYKKLPKYRPQGLQRIDKKVKNGTSVGGETLRASIEESSGKGKLRTAGSEYVQEFTNYPRQALHVDCEVKTKHPTQKPVALFEYLIRTYTDEGDVVMDNCLGSGTTAVAAVLSGRRFIGIEREPEYVALSNARIEEARRTQEAA